MLADDRSGSQRQKYPAIEAAVLRHARRKAQSLAMEGVDEILEELLKDGGSEAVLKGIALLIHGEVLPAPLLFRLQEQVARIRSA